MNYTSGHFQFAATDLSNHVSCNHLTQLNRKVALEELKKPKWYDPSIEVLIKRGQEHEKAYVQFLKDKGLQVVDLQTKGVNKVIEAMRAGADVIVVGNAIEKDVTLINEIADAVHHSSQNSKVSS